MSTVDNIVGGMAWGLWTVMNIRAQYPRLSLAQIARIDTPEVDFGFDDAPPKVQDALIKASCDLANLYQEENDASLEDLKADDPDGPENFGMMLMMLSLGIGDAEWFRPPVNPPAAIPGFQYELKGDTLTWTVTSARSFTANPDKVFLIGQRVTITDPEDDTNVIAEGVVMSPSSGGWVGVELDGETRVDEYPLERVWHADYELAKRYAPNPQGTKAAPCKVCGGRGPHDGPGHAYEPVITTPCAVCGGTGPHGGHGHAYVPSKKNPAPRLFRHPYGALESRDHGQRTTVKYASLPGPERGKTPRVRPALGKGKKKNPSDDVARFPLVCKKCHRAIAELRTEPGAFIDATELVKQCPRGGVHEPIVKKGP